MTDNNATGYSLSARIVVGSELDDIVKAWRSVGYTPTTLIATALRCLNNIEPPHVDSIEEVTLNRLQEMVESFQSTAQTLQSVAAKLQNGGTLTVQERAEVGRVAEEIPSGMRDALKKMRRKPLTMEK